MIFKEKNMNEYADKYPIWGIGPSTISESIRVCVQSKCGGKGVGKVSLLSFYSFSKSPDSLPRMPPITSSFKVLSQIGHSNVCCHHIPTLLGVLIARLESLSLIGANLMLSSYKLQAIDLHVESK